ncbi:MAG: tetratricopeptide repeat protein [Acidobacteria bacterium]|nr:MAG: tetratricopeptide repeat protein [Acidobacteriota bacterium]
MTDPTHPIVRPARLLLALGLVLVAADLQAAGGSSSAPPPAPVPPQDPKVLAIQHYNSGVRLREKAAKLEQKLPALPDAKRAKTERKIAKSYEQAEAEYVRALRLDRGLYKAWSDLGYVLRRQGRYDEALEAYDMALKLEPGYAEAIEYRGEAFLGLNRLEDAKAAYMTLFASDRARADELMGAMKRWLEERRADPRGVEAAELEAFAAWLAEREQLAGLVPDPGPRQARSW